MALAEEAEAATFSHWYLPENSCLAYLAPERVVAEACQADPIPPLEVSVVAVASEDYWIHRQAEPEVAVASEEHQVHQQWVPEVPAEAGADIFPFW